MREDFAGAVIDKAIGIDFETTTGGGVSIGAADWTAIDTISALKRALVMDGCC